jgi:nitronate monooxygenase
MGRRREPLPSFLHMYALSGPILEAADDEDASFHLYGQAAALAKETGASALVDLLVEETQTAFAALRVDQSPRR